jgi:homoserine O-acetyltransferase
MAATGVAAQPNRELLLNPAHASWSERAPDVYRARFETNKGNFVVEVERAWAPLGADRFYNLVRFGFYDDQRIFRVLANYIVQWGLSGDPAITAAWKGRTFPDDPPKESNVRGTIGFSSLVPKDTRLTQVYVNYRDNSRNDTTGVVPFGRIIQGMEVLDSLYSGYGSRSGGGMRQGEQDSLLIQGNAYLDRAFPLLDRLIRARIIDKEEPTRSPKFQGSQVPFATSGTNASSPRGGYCIVRPASALI